jgi:rsbT co-antagonist protein RsbR
MEHEERENELVREIEALRRRVEELEAPARRFLALFDAGVLSFQVLDPTSRTIEVNRGWEALWHTRLADTEGYLLLNDEQARAGGLMPAIERAFHEGQAGALPILQYDPRQNERVLQATTRWVASAIHPVKDASGRIVEVVLMHFDVGEIKESESMLRQREEELAAAVAERTAELAEKVRLIEAQQQAIQALSTPVLRLWDGILAVPLIGTIDAARAARIQESLLEAIGAMRAEQVILDITGVACVDAEVMRHLLDAVRAARLLGASCALVGVSPQTARTIVELGVDIAGVDTHATLAEGLRQALMRKNLRVQPRAGAEWQRATKS